MININLSCQYQNFSGDLVNDLHKKHRYQCKKILIIIGVHTPNEVHWYAFVGKWSGILCVYKSCDKSLEIWLKVFVRDGSNEIHAPI